MDSPERVMTAIHRLLSPFPPAGSGSAEDVLRRYVEAVSEFVADDIEGGVSLAMSGKLPGYNGAFAPTPPQLATAARMVRDKRLDHVALMRRFTPHLPPPDIEKTPEQRQRAKSLVSDFVAGQEAAVLHESAEETRQRQERWSRTHDRFRPDMDADAVSRRLMGYSVGAKDSDDEAA